MECQENLAVVTFVKKRNLRYIQTGGNGEQGDRFSLAGERCRCSSVANT